MSASAFDFGKYGCRMWNQPKPAPESRWGRREKAAAARSLESILQSEFDRVLIAHDDNITTDVKAVLVKAWESPLSTRGT